MAITLAGAKITQVTFTRQADGHFKLTGAYALMSSTGVVLAKQAFGGYNEMELKESRETQAAMDALIAALAADVNNAIGL